MNSTNTISLVPYAALALTILSTLAGLGAWLVKDAKDKTRAELTSDRVKDLDRKVDALLEAKARTAAMLETQARSIDEKASVTELEHQARRIDAKADRSSFESLRELLQRVDGHLNRIDDKIEDLRTERAERAAKR